MTTTPRPRGHRVILAVLTGLVLMILVNLVTDSPAGWLVGALVGGIVWLLTAPRTPPPPTDPIWDAAGRKARRRK